MSTIHVKYGVEFRRDLYNSRDRSAWLEAVGAELQKRGVGLTLGEGSQALQLNNAQELGEFYQRYEADPAGVAQSLGLQPGRDIQAYISDLVQALDDIVKDSSALKSGQSIDLSPKSDMSKMLGLDDASKRYASSRTNFGAASRAEGTTSVLGILLSRDAAPTDPLDGVPHMDATTFDGVNMKSGRRSQEYEAVRALGGLDKDQLINLLRSERGGRSVLRRIRKAKDAEAYSVGYSGISLDEMRWDSRAHSIREANPHVSLVVEPDRLEADEDGGYDVGLGTDYNEDTYYDTDDFTLLDNELSIRGRVRRDDPEVGHGAVRRVLIQSKIGSAVDDNGVKFAAKADIRKDRPSAEDIANLDEDVRTGLSGWGYGNDEPIEAVGLVYNKLKDVGALEDVGDQKGVLALEAKAHVRSTRSRFHFNESSRRSTIKLFKDAGEPKIQEALTLVTGNANLDPALAETLTQAGQGLLDKSAILERCKDKLIALDPDLAQSGVTTDTLAELWPDTAITRDKKTTQKRRVVADAIKSAYDEFAGLIDDAKRDIAGTRGDVRDFDMQEEFMDFMRTKDSGLLHKQTAQPFLARLDEELAGPNKEAFIAEFTAWAAENGRDELQNATDKNAAFAALRSNLVEEQLDITSRQIEASGTAGQTLWFDNARKAYIGNERSEYSNFLIDTFDVSEFYTPEAWNKLSDEEKAGAQEIAADKMYHAMVVNEVQIELGYEKPFTDAQSKANGALKQAQAGLFMDFAIANGMDVTADQPATFEALRSTLQGQSPAEREGFLQELNAFAQSQGSPLQFDGDTLGQFSEAMFSQNFQSQDASTHAQLLEDVEMTSFVWDELLSMQEYIGDLRGRRVKREAERAGVDVTWENSMLSKGDTSLTLLRDGHL